MKNYTRTWLQKEKKAANQMDGNEFDLSLI